MLPSQRLWKSLPLNSDDPFRWNCGSRDFTEWFVIWWASGFLLWYDFGWVLAVVVVVIWFWLGFGSSVWLEVMSLKSSDHGGLEWELICDLVGFFTFNVFILWFWLFCGFCALISIDVIWFVIWWASGFLLWFDFG